MTTRRGLFGLLAGAPVAAMLPWSATEPKPRRQWAFLRRVGVGRYEATLPNAPSPNAEFEAFIAGDQWPADVLARRGRVPRPPLVINRIRKP